MTAITEPAWLEATRGRRGIPENRYNWLSDEGSLTRRVVAACPGEFKVRVISQAWGRPAYSEQQMLERPVSEIALIREVELCCNDRPWVFARTLIPVSSLRGRARRLGNLGDKPLGALLFSDPTTIRQAIQFARLSARHALFHAATAHLRTRPGELWGRRTLFRYAGKPILVNEIFLPAIP